MFDASVLIAFCAAALVVLVIPGPGVLYVVARSIAQGYFAAFVSALGLSAGVLVHVAAVAVGLSAILLASSLAFSLIKFIGAGYLIYLGVQMFLSNTKPGAVATVQPRPLLRLFKEGVVVSVFNPKIAIFFMAFLPQFVDPSAGSSTVQFVLLGTIYSVLALCTDTAYGIVAVKLRNIVGGHPRRRSPLHYIGGSLLVGLGIKTALSSQSG